MVLYSAYFGVQILRRWDLKSGSELQLDPREEEPISFRPFLAISLAFSSSPFFFTSSRSTICTPFFVGAMCAAGTLYVNRYGYPALILKVINFLLAGLWLILNYADNRGYDYPLIKKKYAPSPYPHPLPPCGDGPCRPTTFSVSSRTSSPRAAEASSVPEQASISSEIAALPSLPMKIDLLSLSGFNRLFRELLFLLEGQRRISILPRLERHHLSCLHPSSSRSSLSIFMNFRPTIVLFAFCRGNMDMSVTLYM